MPITSDKFEGSCQCCGRIQALPGGVLAKHGYTVDYGWFNGVCQGAGYLPYEQSCGLIESFIKSAKAHLAVLKEKREALLTPSTSAVGWYHTYYGDRHSNPLGILGYHWVQTTFTQKPVKYGTSIYQEIFVTVDVFNEKTNKFEPREKKVDSFGFKGTVFDFVTKQNAAYVDAVVDKQIAQTETYIKWQTKRVTDWKLMPLRKAGELTEEQLAKKEKRAKSAAKAAAKSKFGSLAWRLESKLGVSLNSVPTAATAPKAIIKLREMVGEDAAKLAIIQEFEDAYNLMKSTKAACEAVPSVS